MPRKRQQTRSEKVNRHRKGNRDNFQSVCWYVLSNKQRNRLAVFRITEPNNTGNRITKTARHRIVAKNTDFSEALAARIHFSNRFISYTSDLCGRFRFTFWVRGSRPNQTAHCLKALALIEQFSRYRKMVIYWEWFRFEPKHFSTHKLNV